MSAPNRAGNWRDLWLLAESLDHKARAAGWAGLTDETRPDFMAELADDSLAFALLDDWEARLGLDVADERAALTSLYEANGFPPRLEYLPDKPE